MDYDNRIVKHDGEIFTVVHRTNHPGLLALRRGTVLLGDDTEDRRACSDTWYDEVVAANAIEWWASQ